MHDHKIREHLHKKVLYKYHQDKNSRVIDELALNHGSVRVDVAVANGILHGYEIKGEYDNLKRLPTQLELYSSIFDKVTLVVSEKHLDDAINIIPNWWGVYVAEQGKKGAVHFPIYRKGKLNRDVDLELLAKLLWKEEALNLLKGMPGLKLSGKTRSDLYSYIVSNFEHRQLRDYVCAVIKNRQYWRGH